MMNFTSLRLSLVGLTLAAMLSACSNEETTEPSVQEPSIQLTAQESEIGALNFTVQTEHAERCAYVCINAEQALPTSADEIFAQGTELEISGNDNIPVRIAVEDEATYAIIAAAANPSGSTVSNKLELTPKKNETPTPGTTEVAFKTGQLLYLPNGMLMINLYESENTEIYQTQIKIEGLENNGALQNNSRLLAEGMYKTLSPAYLIDMQGDSDIDDNLPAGSMVKIERGTEGKVLLTVSGTLSKSEVKFKGTFTGTLENEVELKGYSINDISFDETGGAKWDAEAGTIQIPLRSSALPELGQLSLVFRSETENLQAGNYPIASTGEVGTVSLVKAYLQDAPLYVDGALAPAEIGYQSGTVKVEVTGEEYTITIDARDSYDLLYAENLMKEIVYGGTLTGSYQGKIDGMSGEDPDPDDDEEYYVWQDTYSNTPAVVSYGFSSELEGYERSYIGRIDLQPDTKGEVNMRLYFRNTASDASAAGFDPAQIEFIPVYSYVTLGDELDDPVVPYLLMEGDLKLSYDSSTQDWTLHFEGFIVAPVGHKIKIVGDYVGPMDGFTAL